MSNYVKASVATVVTVLAILLVATAFWFLGETWELLGPTLTTVAPYLDWAATVVGVMFCILVTIGAIAWIWTGWVRFFEGFNDESKS